MKTTLDLADDLLIEAKTVAVRRRTTLRALVEHALRREIQPENIGSSGDNDPIEFGPDGIASLKRRGVVVTSKLVYQMMEEEGI